MLVLNRVSLFTYFHTGSSQGLSLVWVAPWNAEAIGGVLSYDIWLQEIGMAFRTEGKRSILS